MMMLSLNKVYNYFDYIRPYAFIGSFIVIVCSSFIAINSGNLKEVNWILIIFGGLSCGFLASAGYALNNIFDIEIDRINKPSRPLPSKKISLNEAYGLTIFLYLLALIFGALINWIFFLIIIIMAILTLLYSLPSFSWRKYWIFSILIIILFRGLLIVLAGWSIVRSINHILPWYVGIISSLFLIGAGTTKDIVDIKGDRKKGCKTLPVIWDIKKTVKLLSPFFIFPFLLIPIGIYFKILISNTLPLTLLSIYGLYTLRTIIIYPKKLTKIEHIHISWKHAYMMYMIFHVGVAVGYII